MEKQVLRQINWQKIAQHITNNLTQVQEAE